MKEQTFIFSDWMKSLGRLGISVLISAIVVDDSINKRRRECVPPTPLPLSDSLCFPVSSGLLSVSIHHVFSHKDPILSFKISSWMVPSFAGVFGGTVRYRYSLFGRRVHQAALAVSRCSLPLTSARLNPVNYRKLKPTSHYSKLKL